MKKTIIILVITLFGLILSSCEDPLGLKKDSTWSDDYNWDYGFYDATIAVLTKAYQGNPNLPDNFGNAFLDAATDNAIARNQTSSAWLAGNGGISKTNAVIGNWDQCYNMFQYIHEFLRKGLGDDVIYYRNNADQNAAIKRRLEGEAYFLRAWWGFQLLQRFGGRADDGKAYGYPIVTEFVDINNAKEVASLERNTYEECVQQIIDDCDAAFERLPVYWDTSADVIYGNSMIGRGSGMAAYLLRSRVALYAASPAYQDAEVVRIDGMGEFTVLDETAYAQKWERAATMAREAIDLTGFKNYTFQDAAKFAGSPLNENDEFVFRYRTSGNRVLENSHCPPSNFGKALTQPSHNLYMACAVKDGGYPLSHPDSGYSSTDPYALTLDKRAETLFYRHGNAFAGIVDYFNLAYGNIDTPVYSPDATVTGYYLKKFLLQTKVTDYATPAANSQRVNPYLRKSEAFFNYAEAMNELYGPTDKGIFANSATEQMATIRTAAGITNDSYLNECSTAGKDAMRKLIQNERRLEFAFENHRFFDMRRCLLPLNEPVYGIRIAADGTIGEPVVVETRPMNEVKYYYLPLPEKQLQNNLNLKNNKGWD